MYDTQLDKVSTMWCTDHDHRSVNGCAHAYKRSTEKLCELTSAILNESDKLNMEETNTKDVQTDAQKENVQQVCPNRCVLAGVTSWSVF